MFGNMQIIILLESEGILRIYMQTHKVIFPAYYHKALGFKEILTVSL